MSGDVEEDVAGLHVAVHDVLGAEVVEGVADLGADVIRVEPPGGSQARRSGPFLDAGREAERSLSFAAYNRNKRSIELDFESDEGRTTILKMVEGADFVQAPVGPDNFGFDLDAVVAIHSAPATDYSNSTS